jgi:arylsulfatase
MIMSEHNRPNIILLMADQMRFDAIGAAGSKWARTPNLDRLAAEGCFFANAFCTNPVCTPARHNILTGLPARFHGYWRNSPQPWDKDLPVMPRLLSDAGYATQAIGHMGFCPQRHDHGFDDMLLAEHAANNRDDNDYALYLKDVGFGHVRNIFGVANLIRFQPQRSLIPEEHHLTTWIADRSIEFLRGNRDRPFFLWASWFAPHAPFQVPDSFSQVLADAPIPDPVRRLGPLPPKAQAYSQHEEVIGSEQLRRSRELYHSHVSLIDKNIGRLLDELDALALTDDTLVLFTSDHGDNLGDLGCFNKSLPYRSCCQVPMILRLPGRVATGSRYDDFVDLNDILPTFLDAAGLTYPGDAQLPGESLLADASGKDRSVQYIENDFGKQRWISLHDRGCQYVYWYGDALEELYDLQQDPHQQLDLMHKPLTTEMEATRQRLRARLIDYESRWGMEDGVRDGDLTVMPAARWTPARHNHFECWPENLEDEDERAAVNSNEYEILRAVRDEPLTDLARLDVDAWVKAGGTPDFADRLRTESAPDLLDEYEKRSQGMTD